MAGERRDHKRQAKLDHENRWIAGTTDSSRREGSIRPRLQATSKVELQVTGGIQTLELADYKPEGLSGYKPK